MFYENNFYFSKMSSQNWLHKNLKKIFSFHLKRKKQTKNYQTNYFKNSIEIEKLSHPSVTIDWMMNHVLSSTLNFSLSAVKMFYWILLARSRIELSLFWNDYIAWWTLVFLWLSRYEKIRVPIECDHFKCVHNCWRRFDTVTLIVWEKIRYQIYLFFFILIQFYSENKCNIVWEFVK